MKQNLTERRTARYWMIAPMEANRNKLFEAAWEYDKQHGTIAVGGCCDSAVLQNVSQFAAYNEFEGEKEKVKPNWKRNIPKTVWDFHHNIEKNDVIIARRGEGEILGIGIVKGAAYYDFAKGVKRIGVSSLEAEKFETYIRPRFREVFWAITGKFKVAPQKLSFNLVQEIDKSQFQKLLGVLEGVNDTQYQNIYEALELGSEISYLTHESKYKRSRTQKQNPNYYIGIDLGTTNSVMAWGSVNPQTELLEPKIVPIDVITESKAMRRKSFLPSCVYFEEGQPPIIGEYAKKMLAVQPNRGVESIKHQIGNQNKFEIDGTLYTPTQILARILAHLAASAKSHFGFIPNNAIITIPAYFNTKMRAATVEAARLADFQTMDKNGNPRNILLDEPHAVLYDHINQEIRGEIKASLTNSRDSKLVLIFDLGGGTLDVSLHRVSYQETQDTPNINSIATSHNTQIGGSSFDDLLADHFLESYRDQLPALLAYLFDDYIKKVLYLNEFLKHLIRDTYRQYIEQVRSQFSLNWDDFQNLLLKNPLLGNTVLNNKQKLLLRNAFRQYIEQVRNEFPFNWDDYQQLLLRNTFRQYAEQAKIDLSEQIEFEKKLDHWDSEAPPDTFAIPTIIRQPIWDKEFRYEQFSLGSYEQIIERFLASHLTLDAVNQLDTEDIPKNNIVYPILDVLRKGEDRMGRFPQVDVVLLNGGMTKFHTIQKRLETLFGFAPLETIGDGAVARGAVVFHYDSEVCSLRPPPRLLPETIHIEIAAKRPSHPVEVRTQIPFRRRFRIKAGTHLPTPLSKPFDLAVEEGETSARLTVIYRNSPNSSKHFQSRVQKFQFGKPLKKEDIPISIGVSINEQGELNVEAHPKNNPDEKFIVTVDLEEELWQERFTQNTFNGLRYLNIDSEIAELIENFGQLRQRKNLDIQRQILNRIETQGYRIARSPSVEEFVSRLCKSSWCERVSSLDNLQKMLVIRLLGNLAGACSDKNCLYEIYNVATKLISFEQIETNGRHYINTVVRSAVETIGKTRISQGESVLFDLLNLKKARSIWGIVIYSIGKCCVNIEAVDHLRPFIKQSKYTNRKQSKYTDIKQTEDTNRDAANWALGQIGSREKKEPLPIQQLTPVIYSLMEQLEMDCHTDIKRNSIYALAEICDRRGCASDVVSPGIAAEVILRLVTFLTNQMRDTFFDSTSSDSIPKLQETTLLAIQMIRGIDLSPDQEASLRAIREEN